MKSDALIRDLVTDLKPVRRLPAAGIRSLRWACLAAVCVAVSAWGLGLRPDLRRALGQAAFVREEAALLITFVLAGYHAFRLSVPGSADRRGGFLPLWAVGVWFLLVVIRFAHDAPSSGNLAGLNCVGRMLWLAFLPALTAVLGLRKAAPLDHARIGFTLTLSALALATLGTQLVCAKDDSSHVLLCHALPLLLATVLGTGLGKRLLHTPTWERRF